MHMIQNVPGHPAQAFPWLKQVEIFCKLPQSMRSIDLQYRGLCVFLQSSGRLELPLMAKLQGNARILTLTHMQ